MTTQEIDKAKGLYLKGCSLNEIGKILNYHPVTIKKYLINNGIKIRSRSEQNILSNGKRKKSVNDNYFKKIGNNQAWLMGFIASDGTIRKNCNSIKIGLSNIDREILEKIKIELEIERPILDYITSNGFAISELNWTSKSHKDFLSKYGIINNKTYFPMYVPKNFNREQTLSFILGYYDGDGTISVNHKGYLRFRICAHRKEILESIALSLNSIYGDINYSLNKDSRGLYELSIGTKYSYKILKDMYSLKTLCLNRKYQKFLEYNNLMRPRHLN